MSPASYVIESHCKQVYHDKIKNHNFFHSAGIGNIIFKSIQIKV